VKEDMGWMGYNGGEGRGKREKGKNGRGRGFKKLEVMGGEGERGMKIWDQKRSGEKDDNPSRLIPFSPHPLRWLQCTG
jgi:hypothetical protein